MFMQEWAYSFGSDIYNAVSYVYNDIIIPKDFIVGIKINFWSFHHSHLMGL